MSSSSCLIQNNLSIHPPTRGKKFSPTFSIQPSIQGGKDNMQIP